MRETEKQGRPARRTQHSTREREGGEKRRERVERIRTRARPHAPQRLLPERRRRAGPPSLTGQSAGEERRALCGDEAWLGAEDDVFLSCSRAFRFSPAPAFSFPLAAEAHRLRRHHAKRTPAPDCAFSTQKARERRQTVPLIAGPLPPLLHSTRNAHTLLSLPPEQLPRGRGRRGAFCAAWLAADHRNDAAVCNVGHCHSALCRRTHFQRGRHSTARAVPPAAGESGAPCCLRCSCRLRLRRAALPFSSPRAGGLPYAPPLTTFLPHPPSSWPLAWSGSSARQSSPTS